MYTKLLAAVLFFCSLPVLATPVDYTITFTNGGGLSSVTPTGSFTYDAAAGFSNFIVQWGSLSFDLTNAANHPTVASGCAAGGASPQYSFLVLTENAGSCDGYTWNVSYYGFGGNAVFDFALEGAGGNDEIKAQTMFAQDTSTPFNFAMGSWKVTPVDAPVPEPGTVGLMLSALVVGAAAVRRTGRR